MENGQTKSGPAINLQSLTDMALKDHQLALDSGQLSAAAEAVELLASLHGLDKEAESEMNQMGSDELRAYIAERGRS